MPRAKKQRGRPPRPLPPRIDATAEEVARVLLSRPAPVGEVEERTYRCSACQRPVYFPEVLYSDGQCQDCHEELD